MLFILSWLGAYWEWLFSPGRDHAVLHPFVYQPHTNSYESRSHVTLRSGSLYGVTLVRNKGPYLREWLDFHFKQGFDQFIVYNHNASDANTLRVLLPYIQDNRVVFVSALHTAPGDCSFRDERSVDHWYAKCQTVCFTQAFNIIRNFSASVDTWVAQFDIDEYMFGMGGRCLKAALRAIVIQIDILHIRGLTFGTSGFVRNNDFDSVIQSHLYRAPKGRNATIKKKLLRASNQWIYETSTHFASCVIYGCRNFLLSPFNKYLRLHHYQFFSEEESRLKAVTNHNSYYDTVSSVGEMTDYFNLIYDATILNATSCSNASISIQ